METKPRIELPSTAQLELRLANVLAPDCPPYHERTEKIARCILDMMYEKTLMYGGNQNDIPLEDRIHRAYYEGVGRKANRLPQIGKRVLEGDKDAKRELVDTYVDIVGYGLLALNSLLEDLQDG